MYLYLCIYIYIYINMHIRIGNHTVFNIVGWQQTKHVFFGKLMLNVDIKPHVGESIFGEAWLATRGHEQRATEQGAGSPWGSRLFTGSGSLGQCIFHELHVVSSCQIQHGKPWKAMESHIQPGKKHLNHSCKQHLNDSQSTFPPCSNWWIRPAIATATLGIPLRRRWQKLTNRVTCRGVHCYEPFLFRPQRWACVVTPPKQR